MQFIAPPAALSLRALVDACSRGVCRGADVTYTHAQTNAPTHPHRYSPDEYALHYGGLEGIFRSMIFGESKDSSFACLQCVNAGGEIPHDPYDAQTPQPMQHGCYEDARQNATARSPPEAHYGPSSPQDFAFVGHQQPQHQQQQQQQRASQISQKDLVKRRVNTLQEIEIKESHIAVKVKKMVRLQADANHLKSKLQRLQPGKGHLPIRDDNVEVTTLKQELTTVKKWLEGTRTELATCAAELQELKGISKGIHEQLTYMILCFHVSICVAHVLACVIWDS